MKKQIDILRHDKMQPPHRTVNDHLNKIKSNPDFLKIHEKRNAHLVAGKKAIPPSSQPNRREITLGVPQGLGDIFWVYQKFCKHFDRINFEILVTDRGKVSTRASDWLSLLPKVGLISLKDVHGETYSKVINKYHSMNDIVDKYNSGLSKYFYYACNNPLEIGKRIEDIDPDFAIEETVPIKSSELQLPFPEYTLIYVCENSLHKSDDRWHVDQWNEFFERYYDEISNLPMVLIGATYDERIMVRISDHLTSKKIPLAKFVQISPPKVCYLMEKCKVFLGYQSGLNIMADNLDIPQFMLYFPYLQPMMYTWCKKNNIQNKFLAEIFSKSPKECIDLIKRNELFKLVAQ